MGLNYNTGSKPVGLDKGLLLFCELLDPTKVKDFLTSALLLKMIMP